MKMVTNRRTGRQVRLDDCRHCGGVETLAIQPTYAKLSEPQTMVFCGACHYFKVRRQDGSLVENAALFVVTPPPPEFFTALNNFARSFAEAMKDAGINPTDAGFATDRR